MRVLSRPTVRVCCLLLAVWSGLAGPGGGGMPASAASGPSESLKSALSPAQWKQMEGCVDRALAWIASSQAPDGSFPSLQQGQPAVTSLCVLAFLSRGHQPGFGPYGVQMNRAIDFVLSCQESDGLFDYEPPSAAGVVPGSGAAGENPGQIADASQIEQQLVPQRAYSGFGRNVVGRNASGATYNHAIAGLMLGEVFGHVDAQRTKEVKLAIDKALLFTRNLQTRSKESDDDKGGWRYIRLQFEADSDLSVTGWHLMFLRSARNAEFNVPQAWVDEAMDFVHRCWVEDDGLFHYTAWGSQSSQYTRGLMGSAIVSLSLAGQHESLQALAAGDWLLAHPYQEFGQKIGRGDRFYYSTYYCSQAAAQLGGRYWKGIYPPIVETLVRAQEADGSFPSPDGTSFRGFGGRGGGTGEAMYGQDYMTAMAVLSLTPAYQLLPVYQR